jgi:hypothetical protein
MRFKSFFEESVEEEPLAYVSDRTSSDTQEQGSNIKKDTKVSYRA